MRVNLKFVWVNYYTLHTHTQTHTHTYVQIHHSNRHQACCAYPNMCVDVFVSKVYVQSMYGVRS